MYTDLAKLDYTCFISSREKISVSIPVLFQLSKCHRYESKILKGKIGSLIIKLQNYVKIFQIL